MQSQHLNPAVESLTGIPVINLTYFDAKKESKSLDIGQLIILTPFTYLDPIDKSPPFSSFAL